MCRNTAATQRGSSLVIAVFVMVVMSVLALTLLTNLQQQDSNLNLDVNHTRAITAADSGADWALARVFNRTGVLFNACSSNAITLSAGSGFPTSGVLANCTADVICDATPAAIDDEVTLRLLITAIGRCGEGKYQAEHKIEVLAYE